MGDIVQLREPQDHTRRDPSQLGEPAQILFFTGVRYERWAEDRAGTGEPPRRKRRASRSRRRA